MRHEPQQPELIPAKPRRLCSVADIEDGGSSAFPGPPGAFTGLFAVRNGSDVRVYVNACPHLGTPLDWVPGRFLSADRSHIICATHGAEFRLADGVCVRGPCQGEALTAVPATIAEGSVWVAADAGG